MGKGRPPVEEPVRLEQVAVDARDDEAHGRVVEGEEVPLARGLLEGIRGVDARGVDASPCEGAGGVLAHVLPGVPGLQELEGVLQDGVYVLLPLGP